MSDNNPTDLQRLEQLATDESAGVAASVLRENARLQLDVQALKSRILRTWGVVLLLGLLMAFMVYIWAAWFPKYRYVPTKDNRAVCEVSPQDSPNVTPASVTEFAKEAVISANTYDYVNYKKTISEVANEWFTESGRKAYLKSLDSSGNLERVTSARLTLRAMAIRVPQLEEEGMKGNVRYWTVNVPIAIEFYGGSEGGPRSRQDFLASVTVVQTPASAANLKGIGIESVTLKPFIERN